MPGAPPPWPKERTPASVLSMKPYAYFTLRDCSVTGGEQVGMFFVEQFVILYGGREGEQITDG